MEKVKKSGLKLTGKEKAEELNRKLIEKLNSDYHTKEKIKTNETTVDQLFILEINSSIQATDSPHTISTGKGSPTCTGCRRCPRKSSVSTRARSCVRNLRLLNR